MDIEARMKESHRIDGGQMVEGGEARLKQNVNDRKYILFVIYFVKNNSS
jgi:hypothetical protein